MANRTRVRKVLAYVTQDARLLVFAHRDYPKAGLQVPAGTVEPHEPVEGALFRELHEESGLTQVRVERLIAVYDRNYDDPPRFETHERHVFHLTPAAPLPDAWQHTVHGDGDDRDLVFLYRWLPLDEAQAQLAGSQGDQIPALRAIYPA